MKAASALAAAVLVAATAAGDPRLRYREPPEAADYGSKKGTSSTA